MHWLLGYFSGVPCASYAQPICGPPHCDDRLEVLEKPGGNNLYADRSQARFNDCLTRMIWTSKRDQS